MNIQKLMNLWNSSKFQAPKFQTIHVTDEDQHYPKLEGAGMDTD